MIEVESVVVGAFQVNCWILWGSGRKAIVVDPGADAALIESFLSERELTVGAYMLTHGHADHIGGLSDMLGRQEADIGLNGSDAAWAFSEQNEWPPFYSQPTEPAGIARPCNDGDIHNDAGLDYRVITTPGHSPGSVCFYFENEDALVCGDTLFQGSVGRTDLPRGDSRALATSLQKLAVLPDHTVIYPGHGPVTTVGQEKRGNYFMQSACAALER